MNITSTHNRQQGAALLIALVMLLALTILAVTSMRGVTLESRITANRIEASRLQNLADAALREGEFRFYGPAYLREKLEPHISNCTKNNKLNKQGNNKPCLLKEMNDTQLERFFNTPISFLRDDSYGDTYSKVTGIDTSTAGNEDTLAWMPYRGLDPDPSRYVISSDITGHSYWNSYRVISGANQNESVNPEYGAALEGRGTYFFLVNGQGDDQIAAQSTIAVVYVGLNN